MLIKRPFLWIFGIFLIVFLILRIMFGAKLDEHYYCMESGDFSKTSAVLEGTLSRIDTKSKTFYLYLKNVTVCPDDQHSFCFSDFLVITPQKTDEVFLLGNILQASGKLFEFQVPTSPGQFNEKAYYKEMNIYYKLQAESVVVLSDTTNHPKQFLYTLQNHILNVYRNCMEEQKAGIISAMLLGEKSFLDADIKSLYQTSGIGHILAISGLHITILCTLLGKITFFLHFPRKLSFGINAVFLLCYGTMTGFGVSTSRAVIMMLMALLAAELGRSYDSLTSMAFSAICILLQKPYALFSSGFLLSYGAVTGVHLIYPSLKKILFGSVQEQAARKRKAKRNSKRHILFEKITDSLLVSISVQLAVLPVLLYFFYEIPTYAILLNLFVLPFVSVVVSISLLSGITGLFFLPAARIMLCIVSKILDFYELFCNFFLSLPQSVLVLGRPSEIQIICYYLLLSIICIQGYSEKMPGKYPGFKNTLSHTLISVRDIFLFAGICAAFLALIYRPRPEGLKITMLDVGQGDGIFIQTDDGTCILIDGGSTSESQIGKYRILPFLKFYGIRKLDYLLMTHPDEDHISGQRELLEGRQTNGIKIGAYIVPLLSEAMQDQNYQSMVDTAQRMHVPVYYIHAGNKLEFGEMNLFCLHPSETFSGSSVNACSVTLSLSYPKFTMLLTGDLEAEGEKAVLNYMQQEKLPVSYTILKVAHHGSKNATCEEFLAQIKAKTALISCGENNRYGHPHFETLERLKKAGSNILTTAKSGTITIDVSEKVILRRFLPK